jgi:Tol biopolymer transport system component
MVQDVAGGHPVVLANAPRFTTIRWSPDGRSLLFYQYGGSEEGFFVVPYLGGRPTRISPGGAAACWSPDGSSIAVAHFRIGEIWILDTIGRRQRTLKLHSVNRWIADIDWSPSNGFVFVANDEHNRHTIWTIEANGEKQTKVWMENGQVMAARWAPGTNAIYYSRRDEHSISIQQIATGDAGPASAPRPLMTGIETDGDFSISVDGTRLVHARGSVYSNLWRVDLDQKGRDPTLHRVQLTHGTSLVERPRISPDGTSVVFSKGRELLAELFTMPIDGGEPQQLTFLNALSIGAVWSTDGKWIAFGSTRESSHRVWLVPVDGGQPQVIGSNGVSSNFELAWAPGSEILYQQPGNQNFAVLDPRTRLERTLVADGSVGWLFSPTYSQDARKIAVAWSRRDKPGLWILEGSRQTHLHGPSTASIIGWSADGTSIYQLEGQPGSGRAMALTGETTTQPAVFRISTNTGQQSELFKLPFGEVGSIDMTPDGRRFICVVYQSQSDVWIVDHFADR